MKTNKKTLRCKIGIFLFLCFSPLGFISAAEHPNSLERVQPLSSEEQSILRQIVSYLSQHSLAPFLRGGQSEYIHLDFVKDSWNKNTHALGKVIQGDTSYFTLFSINPGWFWEESKANLVYITADQPISPTLFQDVSQMATFVLPKDLSHYHVFIEKKEELTPTSTLQRWTFFNPQERIEVLIVLTPDGQGGCYFQIKQP